MKISLRKSYFTEKERTFIDFGDLKATLFMYESGIHGMKLANETGYMVVLPFKGQQVWNVFFRGRQLNMKTMYQEPKNTDHFINTYGCFVMHCGPVRMGCPGPEDDHPLHGVLPYVDYDEAAVVKYHARPLVKLYAGSSLIDISMTIENYSGYPMELMYMCHVNFRPVDYGRIVQSVDWAKENMELRTAIPEHVKVSQDFKDFLDRLEENPKLTEVIKPEDEYNPEIVFFIHSPKVDKQGWSHYMQVHPDGSADYLRYKPEELDHGTRWISRTKDQAGLGLALPATCDPEGYTAEKKKGNIKEIAAQSSVSFTVVAGYLEKEKAQDMEALIGELGK